MAQRKLESAPERSYIEIMEIQERIVKLRDIYSPNHEGPLPGTEYICCHDVLNGAPHVSVHAGLVFDPEIRAFLATSELASMAALLQHKASYGICLQHEQEGMQVLYLRSIP